jgi:hypothetical protein
MRLDTPAGGSGSPSRAGAISPTASKGGSPPFARFAGLRRLPGIDRAARLFAVRPRRSSRASSGPLAPRRALRRRRSRAARASRSTTLSPALDGWRGERRAHRPQLRSGGPHSFRGSADVTFDGDRRRDPRPRSTLPRQARGRRLSRGAAPIDGRYASRRKAATSRCSPMSSAERGLSRPERPRWPRSQTRWRPPAAPRSSRSAMRWRRRSGGQGRASMPGSLASCAGAASRRRALERLRARQPQRRPARARAAQGRHLFLAGRSHAQIDGEISRCPAAACPPRASASASRARARRSAAWRGSRRWQAGGARLELAPIRFTAARADAPGSTRRASQRAVQRRPGGRPRSLPISGRFGGGGFAFGERCTPFLPLAPAAACGWARPASALPDRPRARLARAGRALQGGASIRAPRLPAGSASRRSASPRTRSA